MLRWASTGNNGTLDSPVRISTVQRDQFRPRLRSPTCCTLIRVQDLTSSTAATFSSAKPHPVMEGTPSPMSRKRALAEHVEQTQSVSTSGSVSTSQSGLGSPSIQPHKRPTISQQHQHLQQAAPVSQFPVLDYHMQQCHQSQGCYLNNTLQPADSSTWSNWQQLPVVQQLELLNQAGDSHMADSQPQLTRANSAPELIKLTQADSAAWQQAHAASSGGANLQPASAALLSHKDFWVI